MLSHYINIYDMLILRHNMNTRKTVVKKIHRLGSSHAVIVAPSLVKALNIDEMSFVTQEQTRQKVTVLLCAYGG